MTSSVHRAFQVFVCSTMSVCCQPCYMPLENSVSGTDNGHNERQEPCQEIGNGCVKVFNFIFTLFCWVCGLYFERKNTLVCWFFGLEVGYWWVTFCQFLTFVVMFLVCICHFGVAITLEVCRITNSSCILNETNNCTLPHEYWKISTAVTLSTFAASVSYVLMTVFILIPANICPRSYCGLDDKKVCHKICCNTLRKLFKDTGAFLSPFNVRTDDGLTHAQRVYFLFNYLFSFLVFAIYTTASIVYAGLVDSKSHCMINDFNLAWFVLHACFHFCAIHSCFIFSKVIYIATNKLEKILTEFDKVDKPYSAIKCDQFERYMSESDREMLKEFLVSKNEAKRNNGQYYLLQNIYLDFVKQVKPTLDLLGYWFIAHWLLHALTTVVLSAVVIELVVNPLQYKMKKVDEIINIEDKGLKAAYLVYIIFFALEHAYLFVYPCFRAASVAVARVKLTNAVLKKRWRYISIYVTNSFVQYLTSQNFAFKVSIFCAELSFGLSMACVSLILALYGGLIKLND